MFRIQRDARKRERREQRTIPDGRWNGVGREDGWGRERGRNDEWHRGRCRAAGADSQAVVTCDGGIDAGPSPCRFSPAPDGGLSSFVAGASNCAGVPAGGGTGALIQFDGTDGQGNQINLTFRLATALTVGQTGTFQASLVVDEFTDGSSESWSTPGNDCTLVIASDVCAPTFLDSNETLITGSGQCSQPAQATLGGPAIDIGAFTFTGLVE